LEVYHALHLDVCSRFLIKGTKVSDQGIYIVVHLNRWKRKMVDQKQKTADIILLSFMFYTCTFKPVLRSHLWDKENVIF
jgi:hypothetical protein